MATLEGTRASAEFMCVSLVPDVCKSPTIPVPYKILSLFDCAVKFSTNVRFRKQWVFRHNSRLSTVRCDEPGVGGGILSGVNMGFCRPIDGTSSTTVKVNGSFVDYHVGTYMFMNCAGPEGPFNTIGQVIFLGNMLPGPVSASGKVPKSCILGDSGMLADLKSKFGDIEGLIKKGKQLYALAQTDWSNPSAVLGAMGGLAGIAGLQDVAKAAGTAKELYDVGNKIANTDWSDPAQALSAVAGAAGVAGMKDIAQVANLANTIRNTINTDWSDPTAALASATNLMKATGLNKMSAEMASNAILDSNIPVSQSGTTPPFFPKPGTGGNATTAGSSALTAGGNTPSQTSIPPSADGLPRKYVTPEVLDYLKESNPAAYDRFNSLPDSDKANAFIETQKPAKDSNGNDYSANDLTAIYIPGEGFSTSKAERDGLPNVSGNLPDGLRNTLSEVFVASKDSPSIGSFFGIKEKEGNVYLLGGLVDLGSPEMPGAGNTSAWWVPDRILNMDMSPYYDYHDKGYYGSNVGLSDLGKILNHEIEAFKAGATMNPLQLPLQAIYSAATTAVGVGTAAGNDLMKLGSGTFSSIGDFFGSVFGSSASDAASAATQSFAPGGCFPTMQSTIPNQSIPGAPGSAPAAGSPAKPTTAGAPGGSASGAGSNGVVITTKAGSPAAAAAAIEAQFRKDNQTALEKAQAEDKAKRQQNAQAEEKVGQEKSDGKDAAPQLASHEGMSNRPEDEFLAWWQRLNDRSEPVRQTPVDGDGNHPFAVPIPGTTTPLYRPYEPGRDNYSPQPMIYTDPDGNQWIKNCDAYNCHSYAWHDAKGDSSGDSDSGLPGAPRWDNSNQNEIANAYKVPDGNAQVGDIIVYGPNHSGVVAAVDSSGKPTQVVSKWGQSSVHYHAPEDAPASYGPPTGVYRPIDKEGGQCQN